MELTDIEVRILASLAEKEATTPDNYPLSLNALTNACNQLSNREPVMSLSEDGVKWAVNNLRQQSLVRAIQPSDARVMKFRHLLTEKLNLDQPALGVLCVLMLRGPQTLGEIRARTNRLADFQNPSDVEAAVNGLVSRDLVVELPRRPGQKEVRFAHLLSGAPTEPATAPSETMEGSVVEQEGNDTNRVAALEATIESIRGELAELREEFEAFRRQFG